MTEAEILKGCLNNVANAQQRLYALHSPKMLALCFRYANNRADAEDMLQEGFVKIFINIKQYRNDGAAIEAWIRRIVVHTCITYLKKNKKFADNLGLESAEHNITNTDNAQHVLQAKQIIDCIRALPIGYRTVLNLYAIEGYSHKEIGELLDIEESTSRSQYTRAKNMLHDSLVKKRIIPATITQPKVVTVY